MIIAVLEVLRILGEPSITLYTLILVYFWFVWGVKFVYSRFYKPTVNDFKAPVTLAIPTYKEDKDTLRRVVTLTLRNDPKIVEEILIVTDEREPEVTKWCRKQWSRQRVRVIVAPRGKRPAIMMAIARARNLFVVVIESDTFTDFDTVAELIKPFADPKVGGVVGDQLIFQPYRSLVTYFNHLAELIKYRITIPALSVREQVTVLGGRCVAYRREAVLSLLDGLIEETFLGKPCVSGDDGRLTSLLLQTGWKCLYQSTARTKTVSPPTWGALFSQRLRWFRNSCRRTTRALLCWREKKVPAAKNRFWVWKHPLAAWQMITTWTNSLMMIFVIILHAMNIQSGEWMLVNIFGPGPLTIVVTAYLLWVGGVMTRFVRVSPCIAEIRKVWWAYVSLLPFYLLIMWLWRLYAICTMNKQGWLTRKGGPGGFAKLTTEHMS